MAFSIITDSPANLDTQLAKENDIKVIPFTYSIDCKEYTCKNTADFNDKEYYDAIRNGMKVSTSQITPQKYIAYMEEELKKGKDILFIGLSSGVSGSFDSACMARKELIRKYPEREICLIDSYGAGLGEGLLVYRAAKCRENGMELGEVKARILKIRKRMYQVFTVDSLMHLKRTGRLSNASAVIGTVLNIKPLLKGNEQGKIVAFAKLRGRKQSIKAMADKYEALARNPEGQVVGISHADCEEDALYLKNLIEKINPPLEIMLVKHEPVTGSHIGPGALALFFEGDEDVREK
ncbi:MAG: DegV family protein [Lachnospiraceae bacterium]|nr:DegV family protein [Lachnospiraceae bacterium]